MYFEFRQTIWRSKTITKDPKVPESFSTGRVIKGPLENPLVFQSNFTKDEPPSHLIGSRFPVMSRTLVRLLENTGVDNLQTFPAIIKSKDAQTSWDEFFAVNIVGSIACADLDASEFRTISEGGPGIRTLLVMKKLVIKKEAVPRDLLLFRLNEDPLWMIAHETVVRALKENPVDGGWGIDVDPLEES